MVGRYVAVTVGGVPSVTAGAPGQGGLKWRKQVVQSPGHNGVVVEGYVEGYNADGKANPCINGEEIMTGKKKSKTHIKTWAMLLIIAPAALYYRHVCVAYKHNLSLHRA